MAQISMEIIRPPGSVLGGNQQFDGLLHMKCVRSPHHHARIRSIDTSAASSMPGVKRIILGKDVPHNLNTLLSLLDFGLDDEPLISEK